MPCRRKKNEEHAALDRAEKAAAAAEKAAERRRLAEEKEAAKAAQKAAKEADKLERTRQRCGDSPSMASVFGLMDAVFRARSVLGLGLD